MTITDIQYATIEDTADGTWLHLITTDDELVTFELTMETAVELTTVLSDWMAEERER